jgi:2-C-methyl-D-erythritol 2,4-cyclodiphosphate synthase
MRVGIGCDIHKLEKGRPLVLGGVHIEFPKGLLGHSDADVLAHAIGDALLGASGLGDLGKYFPDTDMLYKGISSLKILGEINRLILKDNLRIINIDSVILAQEPKIDPYRDKMKENIATALEISASQVNIKATTTENLGSIGRKEGISAYAVVLLQEKS